MPTITYYKKGGEWISDYHPSSYTEGIPLSLPTKDDIAKDTDPACFAGWYTNSACTIGPWVEIPNNASGNQTLFAKWIRYTPNASGKQDAVDILTSGIYPYDYEGHNPIRILFGVRPPTADTTRPIGTIEVRDANTGEFLYDYTDMQQMNVDNANIGRLTIGRYVFSPHRSTMTGSAPNDSLLVEYMGDVQSS